MAFTTLTLSSRRSLDLGATKGRGALRKVANLLQGALSGANAVDGWMIHNNVSAASARAVAGVTMATGSGTVGSVINGTTVSVTWATSDTASITAIVAALKANSTVNSFMTATNKLMKLMP